LLETHFRLALGEIARCVLVLGGNLAYGGHLLASGYTAFLAKELEKYGRRDRPLLICLAWQEHRNLALSELEMNRRALGLFGQIVCLDPDGNEIEPGSSRGENPEPVVDAEVRGEALTGLRRYMSAQTDARVLIGGRRAGFQGRLPGLMEEAILTISRNRPLYLAGGFGGVTSEIAKILGRDDLGWLPKPSDGIPEDPRLTAGRGELAKLLQSDPRPNTENGLSVDENRRLAATHRPGDIAALISVGLGRYRDPSLAP
jgi:hypothetical protein